MSHYHGDDPEWTPRNAEGARPAELTLRAALVESNNAAAVDLQQKIGVRAVLRLASDAGLGELPEVPSLALGTGIVSPLELTARLVPPLLTLVRSSRRRNELCPAGRSITIECHVELLFVLTK